MTENSEKTKPPICLKTKDRLSEASGTNPPLEGLSTGGSRTVMGTWLGLPGMVRLLMGAVVLLSVVLLGIRRLERPVRATRPEQVCRLPGDELLKQPIGSVTHAITIRRPPREVWPWLVQMGSGRAGWYSYDFIDNGGRRSTQEILPQFQHVSAGDVFPALPKATDVFVVLQYEREGRLVLGWRLADGTLMTTWAFVLREMGGDTRLIVRGRVGQGYRPYGLPTWAAIRIGRLAHFIMERKQMLGIKERAERAGVGAG
jgi:hypothetical protein